MPEPDRGPEKTEFYKDTVPEILMDATEKLNEKYDAVIVDEAQDFSSTYWLSIEALLKDKDDSRFYIFLDPHQNIYNKTEGLPYKFPSFSLTVNCRNTKAISNYLSNISGRSMLCMDGVPDGIPPEIIKVKTATEEREAVRRVLHKLVNEDKVPADGIVILGRRRLARSSFGGPCKLGNLNIVEAGSEKFPTDIRYSTIHAFKGLESDVVLLTGAGSESEHISEEEIKTLEYVGASRARTLLYIFQMI